MQLIDFYRLPRPVQDRFAAATRRTAPPAPLLYQKASRRVVWAFLGGGALLAIVAVLLLRAGYGNVSSTVALHGGALFVVDLLLWVGAAYGVVHAMAMLRADEASPFKKGTYLFPACVVEALGPVLHVWPLGEAESAESISSPSPGLAVRMRDGSRVVVAARVFEDAQLAVRALATVRDELLLALAQEDAHRLAEMDPLHGRALSNPLGPSEPMKREMLVWTRFDWAIAAAIGLALGLVLVKARNWMSDEAMFRAVFAQGTADGYEQYLAHGHKHADDVADLLLPRVQLAQAEAQGPEATEAFAQAHVGAKIQPEIDATLHRVLVAELENAKAVGTVGALDEFTKKYPRHSGLDAELATARHALYGQALSAWKKTKAPDAATSTFMDKLFAWAEKASGPTVAVRFRQRPSKTIEKADAEMMTTVHYPGIVALPSTYVKPEALRPREQRVVQDLVHGFAGEIPTDVLSLSEGAPLEGDAQPPTNAPTLVVDYSTEWPKGSLAVSSRPFGVFAALTFAFTATFSLADGTPHVIKTTVLESPDFSKINGEDMSAEDYHPKVYEFMIDDAFDQLDKKLTETL